MSESKPDEPGDTATPPLRVPEARLGQVVDKYTIVRLVGCGGMGAVYEARHAKVARRFAIKFLLPQLASDREVLRRFENEAKAAGGLEHPNLAAVIDFGSADDGSPYLVMEYLAGEDCGKLLRREGPLAPARAANILLQACRGLAVAHKAAIVHRDLKPENLFLTDAGDGSDLVKVLDFGIAKLRGLDAGAVTGTGATFGTAFYMSPEQARGSGDVDHRTDVWALGVVLYELLGGRRPFEGGQFLHVIHKILSADPPPLATVRPGLPPKLISLVEQAMVKEAAHRLPSLQAFAQALVPFAHRETVSAPLKPALDVGETVGTPVTRLGETPPRRSMSDETISPEAFSLEPEELEQRPGTQPPDRAHSPALRGIRVGVGVLAIVTLLAIVAFVLRRPAPNIEAATASMPSATVQPPAPPAPAPTAEPVAPSRSPPAAGPAVRTLFEPAQPGSNKPAARPSRSRPKRAAAPEPPKPAPPVETPLGRRGIEIEQDNPYRQ